MISHVIKVDDPSDTNKFIQIPNEPGSGFSYDDAAVI